MKSVENIYARLTFIKYNILQVKTFLLIRMEIRKSIPSMSNHPRKFIHKFLFLCHITLIIICKNEFKGSLRAKNQGCFQQSQGNHYPILSLKNCFETLKQIVSFIKTAPTISNSKSSPHERAISSVQLLNQQKNLYILILFENKITNVTYCSRPLN